MAAKKCQPKALTPYLDDELAADARQQIEEHLRGCAACGALLDEVTSARERVRGMGRALIPGTTLMPALAVFRERAGIGEASRVGAGDIQVPVPAPVLPEPELTAPPLLETAVMAEDVATDEEATDDETDIYSTERFRAVLELDPVLPVPPAVDATPAPREALDVEPADAPLNTWVAMSQEREDAHRVPDPPVLESPDPAQALAAAPDPAPAEEVAPEATAVFEPLPIPPPPPVPERAIQPEPRGEPGPFSAIVRADIDNDVHEPEAEIPSGPLPWEQDLPSAEVNGALVERPDAPEPQSTPPWVEAEAADAEDIEARGRRLVEEDLAAQVALEHEAGTDWEPATPESVDEPDWQAAVAEEPAVAEKPAIAEPAEEPAVAEEPTAEPAEEPAHAPAVTLAPDFAPVAEDEVAAAVASMREELTGPRVAAEPAAAAEKATVSPRLEEYRGALRGQRKEPRSSAMPALTQEMKIGVVAASAIMIVLVLGVFVVPRLTAKPSPVATRPATHATPATSASPAATPSSAPSPAASANASAIPPLTGTITAGAGGTGYKVLRIRGGSPGAGVTRIVYDLEGTGPAPDAQLGRAADGSLYIQAAGISIDPAIVSGFQPIGPITGMSSAGTGAGLGLRLGSSLAQSPQFSMYYLTGPNRLVIDLK
ncbi:MAG: hypothetical protein QOK05_2762 [Chloroflexota bacterium]|nr:hypothetical protein [Chloroflexota bacterium]